MLAIASLAALAYAARSYGSTPFDAVFERVGKARNVPPNLLRAIARHESGFRANAKGPTNDHGLMQVTAARFKQLGIPEARWYDPEVNVDTAARYLVQLHDELGARFNSWNLLRAYNVGPDLSPEAPGITYASRVLWHWVLYDIGRLGQS